MTDPVRAMSYGGGVQSTAMLVLAVTGRIENCTLALFANVGGNAENPVTLDYIRDVAVPYAATHGIELVELNRGGKNPDLYDRLTAPGSRFLGIPLRMDRTGKKPGGKPGKRACTQDYKRIVIGRELKARGATADNPADVLIGISTDEVERANKRRAEPYETIQYPLLSLGLSRADCARIISDAGLPVPPKSACWFCPFHSVAAWTTMRTDEPENVRAGRAARRPPHPTPGRRRQRPRLPQLPHGPATPRDRGHGRSAVRRRRPWLRLRLVHDMTVSCERRHEEQPR